MGKFGTFFERFFSDFLAEGAGRMVFDQARLRVEKGFETSPTDIRVETNAFIAIDLKRYNPDAHRGLETQRTARRNWESSGGLYSPLDENRLEKILGDMWYNLRDKPGKRLEAFERLGLLGLNDPIEFNRAIESGTAEIADVGDDAFQAVERAGAGPFRGRRAARQLHSVTMSGSRSIASITAIQASAAPSSAATAVHSPPVSETQAASGRSA